MKENRLSQGSFEIRRYQIEVSHRVEVPTIRQGIWARPMLEDIGNACNHGCWRCRGLINVIRALSTQTHMQMDELTEIEAKCTPQDETNVFYQIEAEYKPAKTIRTIKNVRCVLSERFKKRFGKNWPE